MKHFSNCNDCLTCACSGGGCIAGIGDDDHIKASTEQLLIRLNERKASLEHGISDTLKKLNVEAEVKRLKVALSETTTITKDDVKYRVTKGVCAFCGEYAEVEVLASRPPNLPPFTCGIKCHTKEMRKPKYRRYA